MLQNWHAVEQAAGDNDPPVRLALVLALGWSQCLTTGGWPATPWWCALLAGSPPAHGWPRLFWHLCWATAEPQNAAHRDGMLAALAEAARGPHFGLLARDLHDALANRAE